MICKYNEYTDSWIHIPDEHPIIAVQQPTTLTDECIERIAEAVVRKLKEVE